MKIWIGMLAMAGSALAANVVFVGGGSQRFSDAANWDAFPQKGDGFTVSAREATPERPAVVDPAFAVPVGLARIFSGGAMGFGTAHVEIADGAVLRTLSLVVGNRMNEAFDGRLVLQKGAGLEPTYRNSGAAEVGGDEPGMDGEVVVQPGAALFSHAKIRLNRHGRLRFVFGADAVTPFSATRNVAADAHVLNGLIQADLGALEAPGRYLLINGTQSTVAVGGALRHWLDGQAGSFSGTGDFAGDFFEVLNGGSWGWTLAVEGNDLVMTIAAAGVPPRMATSVAGRPIPVDAASWDLASWRAWPFDYEELSVRKAPLATAESSDWIHAGDSWVAENRKKPADAATPVPAAYGELRITDFYLTGGGNADGPNRVFCASAVPDGAAGPFPVLFVFHGGGGHASGALALASARNNPGFATVAIDYNGQFMPSKQPVTRWTTQTEAVRARRLDLDPNPLNFPMYHNVQAARRVVDWVEGQPWADKGRFGAVGISYGGWVSYFLAGVDDRIASVVAQVSAAGTRGMRGRSSQPHDWEPREQVEAWIRHADPASYASGTRAPVFMRLAANDRFFWLDGAASHRALFPGKVEWLVVPNSDHGNGGPDLPDPHGHWHRAIHFNGTPLPSFGGLAIAPDGRSASVAVESDRPPKSVHLAWSPGAAVSPARYWRWTEAREKDGTWTADLPAGHAGLEGTLYFTAVDADGRAASSDLLRKPGRDTGPALAWRDGCLWDTEAGAAAWRSNLSFDKCRIEEAAPGRVAAVPLKAGSKAAFFTNSFSVTDSGGRAHRGIRIELGGNGAAGRVRVMLARDYSSLDEQVFAAEVELSGGMSDVELPWEAFTPHGRGTVGGLFPVNALVVQGESLPAEGVCVGAVRWLD